MKRRLITREDMHCVLLDDAPTTTTVDGEEFDPEVMTITYMAENSLTVEGAFDYSCHIEAVEDGDDKEYKRSWSNHPGGPNQGLAPAWVVEAVIAERPGWFPADPQYIPRPERPLKAV